MTAFLIFLLILFILFRGLPMLLSWWVRRRQKEFQEKMGEAYQKAAREQQQQQRAQERASHIEENAEDAEYVEIAGEREEVVQETFTAEEQVTDAEFEEI